MFEDQLVIRKLLTTQILSLALVILDVVVDTNVTLPVRSVSASSLGITEVPLQTAKEYSLAERERGGGGLHTLHV